MIRRPTCAVVVAFHSPGLLDRCLTTLGGALPVTVVDNSSDASVHGIAAKHGAVYFDAGWNRGFAAGANLGLRQVLDDGPADVLLVNPDAAVDPTTAQKLSSHLHAAPNLRVGAVSPRLVDHEGHEQRVMWPFPSPARAWLEAVGLSRFNRAQEYAIGAVLLLRWEALREVGPFDERYFLYAEEADWQRRAKSLGWHSILASDCVAVHAGAGTSTDPARREALFHAGAETYVRKWFGRVGWTNYRTAMILGASARSLVLPSARRHQARRRAHLFVHGPRRAAGME